MTKPAWAILVGFVILSGTIAYLGRYQTSAMPGGGTMVTDRWFGTVNICSQVGAGTVMCFRRFPANR
jgi:hypothetical protein